MLPIHKRDKVLTVCIFNFFYINTEETTNAQISCSFTFYLLCFDQLQEQHALIGLGVNSPFVDVWTSQLGGMFLA